MNMAQLMHYSYKFRASGLVPMDKNRAMDGLQLRVDFMNEHGVLGSSEERGPCSMFEFLIGLARRMSFLMGSEDNPHRTAHYFWAMIENIGLKVVSDDYWHSRHGEFRVEDAVNRILDRTYDPDGQGSLFPLRGLRPGEDVRTMEIWYQMQLWLGQNSDISLDF